MDAWSEMDFSAQLRQTPNHGQTGDVNDLVI
jgi:hypothetical protein